MYGYFTIYYRHIRFSVFRKTDFLNMQGNKPDDSLILLYNKEEYAKKTHSRVPN